MLFWGSSFVLRIAWMKSVFDFLVEYYNEFFDVIKLINEQKIIYSSDMIQKSNKQWTFENVTKSTSVRELYADDCKK